MNRINIHLLIWLAVFIQLSATSCKEQENLMLNDPEAVIEEITVRSPQPEREIGNLNLSAEQHRIMAGLNNFAFNFLKQVKGDTDSDILFSPISISLDLSMVANAVDGSAREEILQSFGYKEDDIAVYNSFCKKLLEGLPAVDISSSMNISNAIFVNSNYRVKKEFKSSINSNYYGAVENFPFADSKKVLNVINSWVEKNTNGLIPEMVDRIDPGTEVFLLNTLYYKAKLTFPFDSKHTAPRTFHAKQADVTKDFMSQTLNARYCSNDSFSCVTLPLGSRGRFGATIILPNEDKDVNAAVNGILNKGWNSIYGSMSEAQVNVIMPKIDASASYELEDLLKGVGIKGIFNACDWSNMLDNGLPVLRISSAIHKATLKLDESGIEAAAATALSAAGISPEGYVKPKLYEFIAERPFIYVIHENSSGAILFTGVFSGK